MKNEKLENSCFKFTEKLLYNYKEMDEYIGDLEHEVANLKAGHKLSIRSIRYDDINTSRTNNVNKELENKVIDVVGYIQDAEIEAYKEKKLKNKLDKAINNLSPIHKQIIQLKYQEGLEWKYICDKVCYEERQLRTKKNEAVKSIAVALFGSKVFKEEEPTLFDMIDL